MFLGFHFIRSQRADLIEEAPGALKLEISIRRFDAEKKAVAARQFKALDVEYRVVRHGQAIQRQYAKESRQGREQNRQLERNRYK